MATPLPYGLLRQKNPDYREAEWEILDDLYEGGFRMAKNAERHIPRIVGETDVRYKDRLNSTSYLNYFGQIVDYFVAALFTQDFTLTPADNPKDPESIGTLPDEGFYESFSDDCDMRGTRFPNLLRHVLTTALCKRCAYVAVDMPKPPEGVEAVSLYQEELLGLRRTFVYQLPNEQLIDWLEDENGQYVWAILNRCSVKRLSPEETRGLIDEEFKVWRINDQGLAAWEVYRISYPKDRPPKDEVLVDCAEEGVSSFHRIPIIKLELPHGLCIGDKVAMVCREHFQRRSALNAAQNKSLVALPVARLGPEMTAAGQPLPSERAQDPYRGDDPIARFQSQGFIVIGRDDAIQFAEPNGAAYHLVDKQIQQLKDEIFRVVQQMAASIGNDSGALRRSAESKKMDRFAEAIVLSALGQALRSFGVEVYETIADSRGESIVWQPHGLDHYSGDDRDALLVEAVQMDLINIPSITWLRSYKTSMAMKLMPNMPPEVQEQVRIEIEQGISAEVHLSSLVDKPEPNDIPIPPPSASDVNMSDEDEDEDDDAKQENDAA